MNLVVNARDATPNIGTISISTHAVSSAAGALPDTDVPAGDYVVLTVTDEGAGMTPEAQARLYEPFFTTKPTGEGTGLGLATVQGIVEQDRGTSDSARGAARARRSASTCLSWRCRSRTLRRRARRRSSLGERRRSWSSKTTR